MNQNIIIGGLILLLLTGWVSGDIPVEPLVPPIPALPYNPHNDWIGCTYQLTNQDQYPNWTFFLTSTLLGEKFLYRLNQSSGSALWDSYPAEKIEQAQFDTYRIHALPDTRANVTAGTIMNQTGLLTASLQLPVTEPPADYYLINRPGLIRKLDTAYLTIRNLTSDTFDVELNQTKTG